MASIINLACNPPNHSNPIYIFNTYDFKMEGFYCPKTKTYKTLLGFTIVGPFSWEEMPPEEQPLSQELIKTLRQ